MDKKFNKVVLAYSGGLDTSIIIPWLKENYGCEVIAMVGDVGQGDDELAGIEEKAVRSGASKVYVENLQREFVEDYIVPTVQAGAVYEHKYLLGTSMARPSIAKRQVEIAELEGADALAHGCTGKGNDQVRFELTFKTLRPDLPIIAPWRTWEIRSREDAMAYAAARGIPVPVTREKPYSMDRNLWHISYEGGVLEDPWDEGLPGMFRWTVDPESAPDQPEYLEMEFVQGVPTAVNGVQMPPLAIMELLNEVAAKHGVGRVDMVENRLVGMKSRGIYETPGGTVLMAAHQELEYLTLDRDTLHYKAQVALKYAEVVYNGQWFSPLRTALDAFVQSIQTNVTGAVKLKLYKGNCTAVGRKSPYSLYSEDLATFGEDEVYNQADSAGFINLYGLPLAVAASVNRKKQLEQAQPAVK